MRYDIENNYCSHIGIIVYRRRTAEAPPPLFGNTGRFGGSAVGIKQHGCIGYDGCCRAPIGQIGNGGTEDEEKKRRGAHAVDGLLGRGR